LLYIRKILSVSAGQSVIFIRVNSNSPCMNHHHRFLSFRNSIPVVFLLLVIMLSLSAGAAAAPVTEQLNINVPGSPQDTVTETVQAQVYALPLSFIPNTGQVDSSVAYSVAGYRSTLYFTPGAVVIAAREGEGDEAVTHVIRQSFSGSEASPVIEGADQLPGVANYFIGNDPSKWQTNVPTYGSVVYRGLYPGIDLRYTGTEGVLKREFVVAPGADPAAIRLHYEGIDAMSVDDAGALVLATGTGTLTETPVVCYQEIDGGRTMVPAAFRIAGDRDIAFVVGGYDPSFPLVIDPVLIYSTYLGGWGSDEAFSIAIDSSRNAYVTGYTYSSNFPTTAGTYNRTYGGSSDVFITKLNQTGSMLVYSTFLGGSGEDSGSTIVLEGKGGAYVTGYTASADFPTTAGAYNRTYGGNWDAFVTFLNTGGSSLVYSTYLGGSGQDAGGSIAVDSSLNAYVTGRTLSADFPTTVGAYNRTYGGGYDVFVTKLNSGGTSLVYSTYLGGSDSDFGCDIGVDSSRYAYVNGVTYSPDFPTTGKAYDTTYGGNGDAFVTKLNTGGSSLMYSTFLGGTGSEWSYRNFVNDSGRVYVTGYTSSSDFPTTSGAYNRIYRGNGDAFITKLNSGGSALDYSTLLGGSASDSGMGIAVDSSGSMYVSGSTYSSNFPTTSGAFNRTYGGGNGDAIVVKLNPAGSVLAYSTYFGGSGQEFGRDIAVDNNGYVYMAGDTLSPDFPVTSGANQTIYGSSDDAFVVKLFPVRMDQVGVFRPSTHRFYLRNGSTNTTINWGLGTDIPVSGDWNGDGLWDVGVYRNSTHWFYLKNGTRNTTVNYGWSGTDIPVTGDWNGDGLWDVGMYRSLTHIFILRNGSVNTTVNYGWSGTDIPVTGDWNGDGLWDVGMYRSLTHIFILRNGSVNTTVTYGLSTDKPVTGKWS
jgi:hypothetical protein